MNLHQIAGPIVGAVNPIVPVTLRVSTGNTIGDDGSMVPTYADPVSVSAQIQALTFKDLTQLDGLNLNGTRRAIYLYGEVDAIVRVSQKGGDLITFNNGSVWLTAQVLEQWDDGFTSAWCKVAVTLQDGS